MRNKPIFKLTLDWNTQPVKTKDLLSVLTRGEYTLRVNIVYNIYDFHPSLSEVDTFYGTSSNNTQVLKTLHQNNRGYYYTIKLGRYSGAKTQRVYLTQDEVNELHYFIEDVRYHFRDKPIMRDSTKQSILEKYSSRGDFMNHIMGRTMEELDNDIGHVLEINEDIFIEDILNYIYGVVEKQGE